MDEQLLSGTDAYAWATLLGKQLPKETNVYQYKREDNGVNSEAMSLKVCNYTRQQLLHYGKETNTAGKKKETPAK